MPKGIKTGMSKLRVTTKTEITLLLPKAMTWAEGSLYMLHQSGPSEFKLVPYDPMAPAAA